MAKVILRPIGSPVDAYDTRTVENRAQIEKLEQKLVEKRAEVKLGWGESYQKRVREKGKMTAWERVEALAGAGRDEIFPINTFVNDGKIFGTEGRTSPSAGVITAFVRVHDRFVVAIANDNTVASGSWWPKTPEKIIRAQEIALKLRLPVIYLVDCSGLFLPEQGNTFPGKTGAGHIFKMNSQLSASGVPQIAGVFGDCIAGGGYMPIISDRVYMTDSAYMVIAGAALIKGAKSQHLTSHDIGGPDVHVHISNCADERVSDDAACIERIRGEIASLPSSAANYYRGAVTPGSQTSNADITDILPKSPGIVYDVRQLIASLIDDSLFWEIMPHTGFEVVTGIARIGGLYVGIAANVQEMTPHPTDPDRKRPGGILYKEGVAKLSIFSRACNDDGIPLIWLQDISGFDVGTEAEKVGLLGYGSSLIYTNSTNQTPMITVLLRKASGAGYYAMAGLPYDPVLQIATVVSRLAVMEGKTLAIGAFHTKLDDDFQIATQDPKEREQITAGMKAVEERIEADMDPYKSASQMDVDEIVKLSELRAYLSMITESAYQSTGHRRIKNPRIWSLHDLETLSRPQEREILTSQNRERVDPLDHRATHTDAPTITAPIDGLFYLRTSPQDPPFVSIGTQINPGDTIGLIEVMKCFYPIKYEGQTPCKIARILVSDSTSVHAGEPLFELTR